MTPAEHISWVKHHLKSNGIACLFLVNAPHLAQNVGGLRLLRADNFHDFSSLTGIQLTDNSSKSSVYLSGCKSFQNGQNKRRGGCLDYVERLHTVYIPQHPLLDSISETPWLHIQLPRHTAQIECTYRPQT